MAKMVGLSLVVKQGWMRKAVALLDENLPEAEYRKQLEEHLSYEIDSPTNRRKAREILMKIWYLNSKGVQTLQEEGRKLIQKYPDQLTEIGWGMMPLAYPVFLDISRLMGKMFEFEDTITTTQIRKKTFDEYGERRTVDYSTTKIISTMRELGGVQSASVGKQTRVRINVTNPEIVSFMTKVAMYLGGSSYYTFSSLAEFAFLFPFEYRLAKEAILQDEAFVTTNFGGELSVSLKS